MIIIGAIQKLATDTNDNELYEKVNFTESELQQTPDSELEEKCTMVFETATAHAADLLPEGITAAILGDLNLLMVAYGNIVSRPIFARSAKKTATSNLKLYMKENDAILAKKLDKLMLQFKETNPDFYNDYKNDRQVIDLGKHHTRVGGIIKDSTGNVLDEVSIKVEGTDFITQTNAEGVYLFKPFVPGTFDFKAGKDGFQSKTIHQIVARGQNVHLDFVLVPNGGGGGGSNNISGTVRNNMMMPIGGAKLELVGTTFMAIAQADGKYMMKNVPEGNNTLRVSANGYMSKDMPVVVPPSGDINVDVVL